MIERKGRDVDLEVDGGITMANVREVLSAGANVIVSGSTVFRDPQKDAAALMEILREPSPLF